MALTAQQLQQAQALNAALRTQWVTEGIPLFQQVDSASPTYTVGQPTVVNMKGSATGLIKRFILVVKGTVNCASTYTCTPTGPGLANLFSNVTFTDSSTRVRHNTSGYHLHMMSSIRRRHGRLVGAAFVKTAISDQTGFGSNFLTNVSTGNVTGGTAKNFVWVYEIPITVSDHDLRGCIYANQVTANNLVTLTINPSFFMYNNSGAVDVSSAAYATSAALGTALPTLTNLSFTLYQDMLNPPASMGQNVQIPLIDASYAYNFTLVPAQGFQANSDNVFFAAPNRSIMSQIIFWDNFGYSGAIGGDVTAIKVQVANSLIVKQFEPNILSWFTRNAIGEDMPVFSAGNASLADYSVYLVDTRERPLNIQSGGNVGLYFNPSVVQSANSTLNIGYEYTELQAATFNAPGFGN